MGIKSNELINATSIVGTDTILMNASDGTKQVPFSLANEFFGVDPAKNLSTHNTDGASHADIRERIVGKNMLKNWYFLNPINHQGKVEYTESGYTIDMWKIDGETTLTIGQNGEISNFTKNSETSTSGFIQMLDPKNVAEQTTYTFSVLLKNVSGEEVYISVFGFGQDPYNARCAEGLTTYTFTSGKTSEINNTPNVYIWIANGSVGSFTPIAAKLEIGPVQTLAHQDVDGNWVLNEIPDYAEQNAICEQYSSINGEFIGSQHSNLNLLDNPYFIGGGSQQGGGQFPINQRGQTEYVSGDYGIDRWFVTKGSFKVSNNGIEFVENWGIEQRFENSFIEKLIGLSLTFSLLTDKGLFSGTIRVPELNTSTQLGFFILEEDIVAADYYRVTELYSAVRMFINTNDIVVKAAKLELGSVQTLAHKESDTWVLNDPPPNYALELAKCQRYFQRYKNASVIFAQQNDVLLSNSIFYPVMRIKPNISFHKPEGSDAYGVCQNIKLITDETTFNAVNIEDNNFTVKSNDLSLSAHVVGISDIWLNANL